MHQRFGFQVQCLLVLLSSELLLRSLGAGLSIIPHLPDCGPIGREEGSGRL